jgi:hypothetical protein
MPLNNQEYVMNPLTNKPIKINSRAYKQLVNDGLIEEETPAMMPQNKTKKVMYKIQPEQTEEEIEILKQKFDEELEEDDYQVVKGRGKFYKDKLVTRSKPASTKKVVTKTKELMKKSEKGEIDEDSKLTRLEKRIMKLLESDSDEDSDN